MSLSPLALSGTGDSNRRFRALAAVVAAATLVVAGVAVATAPKPFALAFMALVVACAAAAARPRDGVFAIVLLSLVGDTATAAWYPFTKNLSSRESIFFVSDALPVTPLEVVAVVCLCSILLHRATTPFARLHPGRQTLVLLVFGGFVFIGFAHGAATGYNRDVAVLEARPLVYIVMLYVLITLTMRTRAHYRRLCWFALAGILVQSLIALDYYYRALSAAERADLESLVEHSATLAMNGAFVFVVGLLFFAGNRVAALAVGVISVPIAVIYLLSQRRASMVALLVAFFALLGFLFIRRRRAFWRIAPPAIGIGILAVLATWNAGGAIGLPANAVKSVLFPSMLSEGDQGSDVYRQIEAFNLWVTIRSNPVGGFGFGHEFLVVIPLPDISFFEYWRYLPHNSVLWVWIQLGFFGFVAFLFVFARAIQLGARAVTRAESGTDAALIAVGCTYVMMYLVFAYVDIVWDIRPAVVLAVALALCADYEFAGSDQPTPATRDRAVRGSPAGGRRASLR